MTRKELEQKIVDYIQANDPNLKSPHDVAGVVLSVIWEDIEQAFLHHSVMTNFMKRIPEHASFGHFLQSVGRMKEDLDLLWGELNMDSIKFLCENYPEVVERLKKNHEEVSH